MKFVNSSLTKKLIIILIVLLLFNTVYPSMSYAVDLGGILLQPIYWLLLGIYIPTDIATGVLIRTMQFDIDDIQDYSDNIFDTKAKDWDEKGEKAGGVLAKVENQLKKLFIGPDTIFRRRYKVI